MSKISRKMKSYVAVSMLATALVFSVGTATDAKAKNVKPTVTKKISMRVGEKKTIKVKAKYLKAKKFKSTNTKVATVSKAGKITAKKAGGCKIKTTVTYRKTKKGKKLKKNFTTTVKVKAKTNPSKEENKRTPISPLDEKTQEVFEKRVADLTINLYKDIADADVKAGKNTLISSESILSAMMIATNGASSDTLDEMKKALCGDLSLNDFNQGLGFFMTHLEDAKCSKFLNANSLWLNEMKMPGELPASFLETVNKFYYPTVTKEVFTNKTVEKMNEWADKNTDGMIKKVFDALDPETRLVIMNALCFDGKWSTPYLNYNVEKNVSFMNGRGAEEKVEILKSVEYGYVEDEKATGFVKNYIGGEFAFMALLPNEGVSVSDYISGLTGDGFVKLYKNRNKSQKVDAWIPKFKYDYSAPDVKAVLAKMGITKAFDLSQADFSAMGATKENPFSISDVIHKTHIELTESGTRAAAVTAIPMTGAAAPGQPEIIKVVHLTRPFVYAIIDTQTGIPVFIGAVNSAASE